MLESHTGHIFEKDDKKPRYLEKHSAKISSVRCLHLIPPFSIYAREFKKGKIMSSQTSSHQPNYYAVIPASVRYCKGLEPCARLLYGEITALCNQEGFCWARNKYFSDLYGVDDRTIRRWIESLSKNNFIFCEVDQGTFNPQRKIYLKESFKINDTVGQKCPDTRTKMSAIIVQ